MNVRLTDEHNNSREISICDLEVKRAAGTYLEVCPTCHKLVLIGMPRCEPPVTKISGYFNIYGADADHMNYPDFRLYGPRPTLEAAQAGADRGAIATGVFLEFEVKEKK